MIWGVGPTFVLPTATNTTFLGQGKLSMGPSVVALVQPSHWTLGFLANNVWSVAGHANFNRKAVHKPAGEPVPAAVVCQLQHEEGLVPDHLAHRHCQLESTRTATCGRCRSAEALEES